MDSATEFTNALYEIVFSAAKLLNPYDRVRTLEWIKKLTEHSQIEVRNDYIQYLKIMVTPPAIFVKPFNEPPPKTDLVPFAEHLGNLMVDECNFLPKTGKLQPIIFHKSEDNRAVVSIKRNPADGQLYCAMSVTPKTQ